MAKLDLSAGPLTPGDNAAWFTRNSRAGLTMASRLPHTQHIAPHSFLPPSGLFAGKSLGVYNRQLFRQVIGPWPTSTQIDVTSYEDYAGNNTFHNIKGNLVAPNPFELFVWHQLPAIQQANYEEYRLYHATIFAPPGGGITSGWSEKPAPTITTATVGADGSLAITWNLSYSTGNPQFLFSMTPPGAPFASSEFLCDIWSDQTTGSTPPFSRSWDSTNFGWAVPPLPSGEQIMVGVRQVTYTGYTFHTSGNSALATYVTTIT